MFGRKALALMASTVLCATIFVTPALASTRTVHTGSHTANSARYVDRYSHGG
jgi:hypothetical protein